jgi:hypothetical protein
MMDEERPICWCGHRYEDHAFAPKTIIHADCGDCRHYEQREPYCRSSCSCTAYQAAVLRGQEAEVGK